MKKVEELGRQLADALLNPEGAEDKLKAINEELNKAAMEVTGIRADLLSDENLESSPLVLLYWTTLSQLTQMAFTSAAQHQAYHRELDQ